MSRVVLTVGVFDLFHKGHYDLFKFMASLGDQIVVGLHDQQSTFINKGVILADPLDVRCSNVLRQPKVKRIFKVKRPNPGIMLEKIIKEYKEKNHEIVYVRGNDWSDFPGREVLEREGVPIMFKDYTEGISSTKLREKLDEFVQAVYDGLTDPTVPDEDIVPLLEEAIFMPSDAVMRKVYHRLYDDGYYEVFEGRFIRLSKLVGDLWDHPDSIELIPRFIQRMGVNTSELEKNISKYSSLNEFFARSIDLKKRPFEKNGPNQNTIYSPSDGLVLIYDNSEKAKDCFIKSKKFSLSEFLNNDEDLISMVKGGPLVIVRLQPRDVHRMYAPLKGKIGKPYWTGNRLHTVKSDVVTRLDVNVFTENVRVIIPFHDTIVGSYLLMAIGAPLIGSIVLHNKPGDLVDIGQELGYFEYGGSTIALLFPPSPKIQWKFPLNTKYQEEAQVRIHQALSKKIETS